MKCELDSPKKSGESLRNRTVDPSSLISFTSSTKYTRQISRQRTITVL